MRTLAYFIYLIAGVALSLAQDTLTNEAIIKLTKAGIGEQLIINMINQQPGRYSTKIDDLIVLKQAGVGDKVVGAMAAKSSSESVPAGNGTLAEKSAMPATGSPAATMEIGVYYKKTGQWTELLPEVVNWKTGGALKSIASAGVVKKDINGNLNGPMSRNSVKSPLEFLIVSAEGTAITEYQLIRLRLNKNYREFRTITGGILNQQSGAMRDIVPFEGKRTAPRSYEVVLPANLGAGEYGFLAPGAFGGSNNTAAQIGKMYTFRIIE